MGPYALAPTLLEAGHATGRQQGQMPRPDPSPEAVGIEASLCPLSHGMNVFLTLRLVKLLYLRHQPRAM